MDNTFEQKLTVIKNNIHSNENIQESLVLLRNIVNTVFNDQESNRLVLNEVDIVEQKLLNDFSRSSTDEFNSLYILILGELNIHKGKSLNKF